MRNALSLGTFDGLHTGHRSVLDKTVGYRRVAVTFGVPPKSYTSEAQMLMTEERKNGALKKLGINEIKILDFSEVKQMSAQEFLDMLCAEYNPALISCGFNYRFGRQAQGDAEFLESYCIKNGIIPCVCTEVEEYGATVSSTMLRSLISGGNIEKANSLIYGGFGFSSEVISGDKRGRTIGFPTVNQLFPDELVKPRFGVYAAKITIDGRTYDAITNIGIRPTYLSDKVLCETHILNFSEDIYGKKVFLQPTRFLRDEKRFSSLEELKQAISDDVAALAL